MRELLLGLSLGLAVVSCKKEPEKKLYFSQVDIFNEKPMDNGEFLEVKEDSILAIGQKAAYQEAYQNFRSSKFVYEELNKNNPYVSKKAITFRLLDKDKKDVTYLVDEKVRDSLEKASDALMQGVEKKMLEEHGRYK